MKQPWKIRVVAFHDGSYEATLLYPHKKLRWWRTVVFYSPWFALPVFTGWGSIPGKPGPNPSRGATMPAAIQPLLEYIPATQDYVVEDA